MRPDLNRRIECHLDQQLGIWTRVLPWRSELATHLEDAYLAQAEENQLGDNDPAWETTLANFGDVRAIASRLRDEHKHAYWGLRLLVSVACLAATFLYVSPLALLDLPSLTIVLAPVIAFAAYELPQGSIRWDAAARVGAYATLAGTILGAVGILYDLEDPRIVGACMAVSLLSALYGVLFFSPGRRIVIGLIGVALIDFALMIVAMSLGSDLPLAAYLPTRVVIDPSEAARVTVLTAVVFGAGMARFGLHGVARRAFVVGAVSFLLNTIIVLGDMSDPSRVMGEVLIALAAMGLAISCCLCVGDSAHALRRGLGS